MLKDLDRDVLLSMKASLEAELDFVREEKLDLDISRGKPSKEQLALSMDMFTVLTPTSDMMSEDGIDVRNYGCLNGILEARRLMGAFLNADPGNVIIFGGSSLNIMYDIVSKAMTHGIMGSTPWGKLGKVKFLCPVPGYDRHFAVTESFGIEMINIPMDENGPDMDLVEKYVSEDEAVKGIWCVPKYSNPGGVVYSDETVRRFAALKPKAKDFRIFWDNAYAVHHLDMDRPKEILNILTEAEKEGNPDIAYVFGSFSKITFPGSSISAIASSKANIDDILGVMKYQIIGHNKLSQLMHVRYFKDMDGVLGHMRKHAAIMKPKFDLTERILSENLEGLGISEWSKPAGGYFVSFDTLAGCAKETVKRMADLGIKMTGAGATYPYKKDPEDRNIRIAPSFASLESLEKALTVFTKVVKLVSIEKILE